MCTPSRRVAQTLSILIVDDDPDMADSLAQICVLYGHTTRVAYNPLAAIEIASDLCPDLVILDLMMPLMSGFLAAPWIRSRAPRARLVALAFDLSPRLWQECKVAGFHLAMPKPVDTDFLDDLLRQAVEWRTCACGMLSAT